MIIGFELGVWRTGVCAIVGLGRTGWTAGATGCTGATGAGGCLGAEGPRYAGTLSIGEESGSGLASGTLGAIGRG